MFDAASTARIGVSTLESIRSGSGATTASDGSGLRMASASAGGATPPGGFTGVQVINNGPPASARTEMDGGTLRIILDQVNREIMEDGSVQKSISKKFGLKNVGW